MNKNEFKDRFDEWVRKLKERFQRSTVQFSGAFDVVNGIVTTVARLEDEPEKCVAAFSSRREKGEFEMVEESIFDRPRHPLAMSRRAAAAFTSALTNEPVAYREHERPDAAQFSLS